MLKQVNAEEELDAALSGLDIKDTPESLASDAKEGSSTADNRTVFFARILQSSTEEEVEAVFKQYGEVQHVNLFRSFHGSSISKGCGLVKMLTHESAEKAIEALAGKCVWNGMSGPMVVTWMDETLQRRRRESYMYKVRNAQTLRSMGGAGPMREVMKGDTAMTARPQQASIMQPGVGHPSLTGSAMTLSNPSSGFSFDMPPTGCEPGAIKLFVGNIPLSYTEQELLPVFESIGPVIELAVVRDKFTLQSKGSAFLWYASSTDAIHAILQFNLRHVLKDPTGVQDRPLVVRRAKMRGQNAAQGVNTEGAGVGAPGPLYSPPMLPLSQSQALPQQPQPQQLSLPHVGLPGAAASTNMLSGAHLGDIHLRQLMPQNQLLDPGQLYPGMGGMGMAGMSYIQPMTAMQPVAPAQQVQYEHTIQHVPPVQRAKYLEAMQQMQRTQQMQLPAQQAQYIQSVQQVQQTPGGQLQMNSQRGGMSSAPMGMYSAYNPQANQMGAYSMGLGKPLSQTPQGLSPLSFDGAQMQQQYVRPSQFS